MCVCLVRVRLAGHNKPINAGRLEVYYNGVWTVVCQKNFANQLANVACHMLGFRYRHLSCCCFLASIRDVAAVAKARCLYSTSVLKVLKRSIRTPQPELPSLPFSLPSLGHCRVQSPQLEVKQPSPTLSSPSLAPGYVGFASASPSSPLELGPLNIQGAP